MTVYHLATAFPRLRGLRIPLSRDQCMLLMAAINEVFLGVDIYLAHSISGTIVPNEWIPIVFGPIAGGLLILAGLVALRDRRLATWMATPVFLSSIGVGLLGAYFHWVRATLPDAPAGLQVSIPLLVWAPPILGPLTFALVGLFGLSAAWFEDPPDSGALRITRAWRLRLPYSKTRAYFFMVSMGTLATLVSSVLDHARTPFDNPWLWVPTAAGIFGVVVAGMMGILERPERADILTHVGAMLLLIAVGLTGALLHVRENLIAEGTVVGERFLRGAPFLAPMLFADMGTLGLIALMDPSEKQRAESPHPDPTATR
jgi:hypothetical protein